MGLQQFIIPFCLIHLAACLLLAGLAIRVAVWHEQPGNSLLPYVIVASITGVVTVALVSLQWGIINGSKVDAEVFKMRFAGPYWWVYAGLLTLPLLPFIGVFPAARRRPGYIVGFALGALSAPAFLVSLF